MRSYNKALTLYNNIAKPPRSHYWRHQTVDNAKPLNGTGQRHKSIHMTDDGAIYFKLYNTKIATFVPNDDNTYTVIMQYYHSPTTHRFMYEYGLHYGRVVGEHNKYIHIPYMHKTGFASAVLTFDSKTDTLITDPRYSWHPSVATRVVTDKDKTDRRLVRERMKPYVDMALFTADTSLHAAAQDAHQGYAKPFFSVDDVYNNNSALYPLKFIDKTVRVWVRDFRIRAGNDGIDYSVFPYDEEDFAQRFMECVPSMLTLYVSRKADKVQAVMWDKDHIHRSWDFCVEEAVKQFDTSDFAKMVDRQILKMFWLDEGQGAKPYPLFLQQLPRKYRLYDHKCPEHLVNKFRKHGNL